MSTNGHELEQAEAIRAAKKELRSAIGDVEALFAEVDREMRQRVEDLRVARQSGEEVFPTVEFSDIQSGAVPQSKIDAVRRAGCVVVRQTFEQSQAEAWDKEIAAYLDRNKFREAIKGWSDTTTRPDGEPLLFPIHWSKPQVMARQDPRLNETRTFLNSLWQTNSEGQEWFDGSKEAAFGDRIRRRRPGDSFPGLDAHVDGGAPGPLGDVEVGAAGRWTSEGSRKVYRHIVSGEWRKYDPWDAAYRTDPATFTSFRSFQGWTALSEMRPQDGVLHVVPIANAMVYLLLRPLLSDVDDDDLLLDPKTKYSFWVTEKHHPALVPALTPIPTVRPGDTVWWLGESIHAVADVAGLERWGNVMYIPSVPLTDINLRWAKGQYQAFLEGKSPIGRDERTVEDQWPDRAQPSDLTDIGRKQFGQEPW
jgi:hypothetical protein